MKEKELVLKAKKFVDFSQAWFWSRGWQEKEKEVEADYRAGRCKTARNVKEFLRKLHGRD